jgi:hypothetical protein
MCVWLRSYYENKNQTPWPEFPSDCRLSVKLVATFEDRGCYVVRVTDPCGRILGFQDRSCYFFFQVAPQLYSREWVNPVPDPLLLRKSGSAGNRTWTSGSVARNSDHWTTEAAFVTNFKLCFLFFKWFSLLLFDKVLDYVPANRETTVWGPSWSR